MNTPTAEANAERKKPRLMDFIPLSVSVRGETAMMPMIDVMMPTARTNSGNITPTMAPDFEPLNAAAPRMMEASSVTS